MGINGYAWSVLAAVASAIASYLIKSSHAGGDGWTLQKILLLACACGAYGVGFVFYTLALKKIAMSLAYPIMTAVTISLVTLLGIALFNEVLTLNKAIGILLVIAGVICLSQ